MNLFPKIPQGGGFMKKEHKKHLEEINESFGMSYDPYKYLAEIKRIMKKFNAYIFTNKSLLKKYIEFAEDNNYKWEIILWSKSNPVPINNGHYLLDKEYIIFMKESGAVFNSNCGYQKYFTVKSYPIGTKITIHPTEKPQWIIEDLIEISSNPGDIVFDGYAGSGTTLVAAKKLKRKFIGCEINKKYYEMAKERLSAIQERLL